MKSWNLSAAIVLACLLAGGIGVATSYWGKVHKATGSGDTLAFSRPHSQSGDEMLARLKDYARSTPSEGSASGNRLPDVNTMIERLVARLETTPQDAKGWRMLGWSYFHTERYREAVAAYARAVELDPDSAELKLAHEEAKAKASASAPAEPASSLQTASRGEPADAASLERNSTPETMPSGGHATAIRAMVDALANRLESSPRDLEGWMRLMRSRVVLGDREIATTALRKALEVFKDDPAATDKIGAAASELGLKAE